MKIVIVGYSGSGKSTLARQLAEKYKCNELIYICIKGAVARTTASFKHEIYFIQ